MTVWFDEEFLRQHWHGKATVKRGMPLKYSDAVIQVLMMHKEVFALPYRSVERLARSLMHLLGLAFPVPDHTQLSRHAKRLEVVIVRRERAGPVHRGVDSAGLKVCGEDAWKVRQHGVGKRRTWRKVHLAVDGNAKDVIGCEVTTVEWTDGEVFEGLVEQVEGRIESIEGDGAYDIRNAHEVAASRETKWVVPPRENAIPWEDAVIRGLWLWRRLLSRGWWNGRKPSVIPPQYRGERHVSPQELFGDGLASRLFEIQVTEVHARLAAMNVMTSMGMPLSVRVRTTLSRDRCGKG